MNRKQKWVFGIGLLVFLLVGFAVGPYDQVHSDGRTSEGGYTPLFDPPRRGLFSPSRYLAQQGLIAVAVGGLLVLLREDGG